MRCYSNYILIELFLKVYLRISISIEKEIATHSTILSWRIPWTEEPGGLQSMEVIGVRHDLTMKPSPPSISKKYIQMNENCDINLESTYGA